MSKKKVHHEEHVDETWLIPYADMLTLLLALFIVMFAGSQVDKDKLESLGRQFNILFSSGGSGLMSSDGDSIIPLYPLNPMPSEDKGSGGSGGSAITSPQMEEDKMVEIKGNIEQQIAEDGYADRVNVELNDEGLAITIQDVVLFKSGEAEVIKDVFPLLLQMSRMLKELDNDIRVAGHTDDVPIKTAKFRSNWDLSAMRAINVMTFLEEQGGINPERFSIQGYSQYAPKYDNTTETGRAKNRRVEIFLTRKYPKNDDKTDEAAANGN